VVVAIAPRIGRFHREETPGAAAAGSADPVEGTWKATARVVAIESAIGRFHQQEAPGAAARLAERVEAEAQPAPAVLAVRPALEVVPAAVAGGGKGRA
jgi:hypothetical protein